VLSVFLTVDFELAPLKSADFMSIIEFYASDGCK